ncbi:hypothetical protein [uncultured Kordia sp.]|uniref:hypothetical protein n=1 Tax=uncultured Kordia sp. TaxID=507699 RepID=UPI00261FE6BE|nr:hypothetical protein [uncultured Kordia sp.]
MKRIIIILLVFVSYTQMTTAQSNLTESQQYFLKELRDAYGGQIMFANNYYKTETVYRKLAEYSGMNFPVVFNQTFHWGEAHYGGLIILDYSTIHKEKDVLAFVFAHEWGHQALGHQPNMYKPQGSQWRVRTSSTQYEDEADYYAGQFLAQYRYDVQAVVTYLRSLPNSSGNTHSSPQKRAQTVLRGFNSVNDRLNNGEFQSVNPIDIQRQNNSLRNQLPYTSILVEDFNNNKNNWKIGRDYKKYKFSSDGEITTLNVTHAMSNGKYVIKSSGDYGKGDIGTKQLRFDANNNFEISTVFNLYTGEFEVNWDSCKGETDADGSYEQFSNSIRFTSDGEYLVLHHNRSSELGSIGKEGKFTFGKRNRVYLQIIYENGVCKYYINKKLVASVKADVCGNGAVLGVDSNVDVEIDNIMILRKNR